MVKGTLYILCGQAAFMLSGFILHALLGRSLGPELYGIFGILTSFLFIIERFFLGSISKGIAKFIAEKEESSRSIINYAIKIQFFFSLIIFFIFYAGAQQIAMLIGDSNLTEYFPMLSFLIMTSGFYIIYIAALNGTRAFNKQAAIWIVSSFVRILFVALLILAGYSLKGAIWGLVFAGILSSLITRHYCKHLTGKGIFNKKKLVGYSFKVIAFTFAMLFIMNIDLISVKVILKDGLATGLYTATLNLARIPTLIAFPISAVLFPLIVKSVSDNDGELAVKYVNRTLRYLILFSVPLAFMISATSKELITLVYGDIYSAGNPGLSILIFGLTFITISIVMNTVILAACKLVTVILFNFFLVSIDVILNFILINKFGLVGASIATTITGLIGCIFSMGYVFSYFPFTIKWNSFVNVLLSSIVVYFIALKYSFSGILLFPNYLVLYGIYFVMLLLLREIDSQDIKILKDVPFIRSTIGKNIS